MISSQKKNVIRKFNLQGYQKQRDLDWINSSIDIISKKDYFMIGVDLPFE